MKLIQKKTKIEYIHGMEKEKDYFTFGIDLLIINSENVVGKFGSSH